MKVVLLGDTHGNPDAIILAYVEAVENGCGAVIQLGDYGFGWRKEDGQCVFSDFTAEVARKTGIPFYWIDGNHENFDLLEAIPTDSITGHREVLPLVTHLPRGTNLTLDNTTFRAFGGAVSVDRHGRRPHKSWWEQEAVTQGDVLKSIDTGKADIFLSHDLPYGTQTEGDYVWLTQTFGEIATRESIANQHLVLEALKQSGAKLAFHGHIHRRYETTNEFGVKVIGLSHDDKPEGMTYILDTDNLPIG